MVYKPILVDKKLARSLTVIAIGLAVLDAICVFLQYPKFEFRLNCSLALVLVSLWVYSFYTLVYSELSDKQYKCWVGVFWVSLVAIWLILLPLVPFVLSLLEV